MHLGLAAKLLQSHHHLRGLTRQIRRLPARPLGRAGWLWVQKSRTTGAGGRHGCDANGAALARARRRVAVGCSGHPGRGAPARLDHLRDHRALREGHLHRRQAQVDLRRVLYGHGDRGAGQEQGRQFTTARSWPSSPRSTSSGLKDFSFFTFPALAGKEIKVGEARDYWLEHKDGVLSLIFTLPFASPVLAEAKGLTFSVYDPTYLHRLRAGQDRSRQAGRGCAQGLRRQGRRPRLAARQGRSARRLAGPARRSWRQHLQDHHGGMQRPMKMSSIFALFVALAAMLVLRRARVCPAGSAAQEPVRCGPRRRAQLRAAAAGRRAGAARRPPAARAGLGAGEAGAVQSRACGGRAPPQDGRARSAPR